MYFFIRFIFYLYYLCIFYFNLCIYLLIDLFICFNPPTAKGDTGVPQGCTFFICNLTHVDSGLSCLMFTE